MRDINAIRNEALAAAKRARSQGLEPKCLVPRDLQEGVEAIRDIPFLGDFIPPGFEFVRKYFVDASGLGQPGEAALTANQFLAAIRKNVLSDDTYGYGILEAGQFQIYIGEYRRIPIFLRKQAD